MNSHLVVAGLIMIGCAATAVAAPREKPGSSAKSSTLVSLENKRPVSLLNFEIVVPGAEKREDEKIVAKLNKPLATGRSVKLRFGADGACVFDVRWKFEDTSDVGSVDLCKDARIVLTD